MRRLLTCVILCTTGCGTGVVAFLPLPPETENAGAILSASAPDGELSFRAHRWSEGAFTVPVAPEVTLLVYDQTLEQLGLEEGTVDPGALDCALAAPRIVLRGRPQSAGPGWTEIDAPVEILAELIPDIDDRCVRCRRFESVSIDLADDRPGPTTFSKDGRVLIAFPRSESLRLLDVSGTLTPVRGCEGHEYTAIHAAGGDRFWLARDHGVDFVELDAAQGTCTWTSSVAVSGTPQVLDGSVDAGSAELFVGTDEARVFHVDGSAADPVGQLSPGSLAFSLARVGPQDAVFATRGIDGSEMARWRDDAQESVSIARSEDPNVRRLAHLPELGVVAGGDSGLLFRLEGSRLTRWDSELSPGSPVGALIAYERGFLAVSAGQLHEWHPDLGFCPPYPIAGLTFQNAELIARPGAAFIPRISSAGRATWIIIE